MKLRVTFIISFMLLFSGGCVSADQVPYAGLLFSNHKFDGDFFSANSVEAERSARGCMKMILGSFAFGDAGAGRIARDAGINQIAWVDHEFLDVLGIYMRYCTVVNGSE